MTTDYAALTADILAVVPDLKFEAVFVPWSQSRNAAEKEPTLNWRVTFTTPRGTYTTDYNAGCGHCPSYKQHFGRKPYGYDHLIRFECEQGYAGRQAASHHRVLMRFPRQPILPAMADVLSSLLSDADAIDCGTFEEWASNLGYDTDSRNAEAIYRACIDCGLALRRMLGDEAIRKLHELLADL